MTLVDCHLLPKHIVKVVASKYNFDISRGMGIWRSLRNAYKGVPHRDEFPSTCPTVKEVGNRIQPCHQKDLESKPL